MTRSKIAKVAPPIEAPPPSAATPLIRNCFTGPWMEIPIGSPTLKPFLSAVALSIATWFGPTGYLPDVNVTALKRELGMTPKPRFGAPPFEIALPFFPTSCVAWSVTDPSAAATPGSRCTLASRLSLKPKVAAPWFPNACFSVITASEFLYDCV